MFIDILSGILFIIGAGFCLTGGIGILRFPDFFSRVHAAGVTETLAAPLMLSGLMLKLGWTLDTAKVFMILIFILATNPTATHAMCKAALHGGHRPLLGANKARETEETSSNS